MEYILFIISSVVAAIASGLLLYINKPVYALLVILATAVPIILALLLTKNETYTSSNTFSNTNTFANSTVSSLKPNLMLINNTGDFSFTPVSVIDQAINETAQSLSQDIKANYNTLLIRIGSNDQITSANTSNNAANTRDISTLNSSVVKYNDNIGIQVPLNDKEPPTDYLGRTGAGAGYYNQTESTGTQNKYATLKIVKPPVLPSN